MSFIIEKFYIHTTTPGNNRKHYIVEARKAKEQRTMVCNRLKYRRDLPPLPIRLKLTRYSPGKRLDKHNTWGAMKHVIDGVADAYGIDDSDERLIIEQPMQAKGTMHAVKLEIESI